MPAYDVDLSFARAQSLIGGATGSLPYQTANSSTVFVPIGTNGYILQSNGTTATWVAASGITAGGSSQVQTTAQATNANYFPVFVDSNNTVATSEILYTTSSFTINPLNGATAIGGSLTFNSGTTAVITGGNRDGGSVVIESKSTSSTVSSSMIFKTEYFGDWTFRNLFGGSQYTQFLVTPLNGTPDAYPKVQANVNGAETGAVYTAGGNANSNVVLTAPGTGKVIVSNTADSAATTSGAFIVKGGVGIEKTLYVGTSIIMNGTTSGGGNNLVLRGGTGASSEGPQIVMGYGNNTSSAITGQANNSWNIDVASGTANNNFRIFRQNSAGATVVAFESTESSGGVRLISLGVGTDSSGTTGEIRATNEITAYFSSDARLKENVQIISNPIEIVNQIRGVRFDWTDEHIARRGGEDGFFVRKHDIGVIAQEIEAVLPELVATRDDGYKAVKYEKIVPLLIEVVKAQQKQINQIQEELNKLASK